MLSASIIKKLKILGERYTEVIELLSHYDVISDNNRFRDLSKEYAELRNLVSRFLDYQNAISNITSCEEMLKDSDRGIKELAQQELLITKKHCADLEQQLQILLLHKDPDDSCNIFLEIRAGIGGDEAAIFASDLFKMYSKYAENKAWNSKLIAISANDHGGYKEIITRISGANVYAHLKFESGAHRVQRIPITESQGRIHTSACTVAIMPEVLEVNEVKLDPKDLKIDTCRASGAGGQHVNKTDSAVRISHIPTGIVVECQDERSQHKNKARAMSLLQSRILSAAKKEQQSKQAATRKSLIGNGDRSERIRTYNYHHGRITDHRINLTLYKLPEILEGALDDIITALRQEHQINLLASIEKQA